jgi:hypothetical protein
MNEPAISGKNRVDSNRQGVATCQIAMVQQPEAIANSAVEHDAFRRHRPQRVEADWLRGRDGHIDPGRLSFDQPSGPIAVASTTRRPLQPQ